MTMRNLMMSFFLIVLLCYFFHSGNNGIAYEVNCKAYYLSRLPSKYVIPFSIITPQNAREIIRRLQYPIIFKPNRCTGDAINVEKIDNITEAEKYIERNLTPRSPIIAQVYVDNQREFTVLYERHPLLSNGQVIAIVERIPVDNLTQTEIFKMNFPRRRWDMVDHSKHITKEFTKLIDGITRNIPNFYVGRYDIKTSSLEDLLDGKMQVMELNGIFGVDHRKRVHEKLINVQNIHLQMRWILKRIIIGIEANLVHGPIQIIKNMYKDRITQCDEYKHRVKEIIVDNWMGIMIILIFLVLIFLKLTSYIF